MRILVTGGSGFLGSRVVRALAADGGGHEVVSADLREPGTLPDGVTPLRLDVTDRAAVGAALAAHRPEVVVHLAAIVNPGTIGEDEEYRVDVEGTRHVLDGAVAAGVRRVVLASSGAAYGYHADNPVPLRESDAVRGNEEFTYSRHKRLVEEMLPAYPSLETVPLRIGTILGPGVANQITALWDAPALLKVRGSASPFVFVWVDDVAGAMVAAATGDVVGPVNVAGDGVVTVDEIAAALGCRTVSVPAWLLAAALRVGHALRLTVHDAGRVGFLRYRPVLDNTRLTTELYRPRYTSREAFDAWLASRGVVVRP